jgi:hypothetical protein
MERASSRRAVTGIDVSRITQIFQGRRPDNFSSAQVWITGTIVSLILSLILIFIYIKLKPQQYCTPSLSRLFSTPSKAVPVPTSAKDDSIELQILAAKQAKNADATEDIPDRGHQQTRFVQHGTLPEDA